MHLYLLAARLQTAATCLITTKQAAINDRCSLIPAANGPWTLVTKLDANTTNVHGCLDVGPALERHKRLLATTLVPFTNKTTLVAANSLGCSFGAVYPAPSKIAMWFDSHAFATPQGPLPSGAECPNGAWLVKLENGTIVQSTRSQWLLAVPNTTVVLCAVAL
ncbi:hypothetical protein SDRG_17393 [Saprolegnia diclina VS20]|uniref:Uncharacterized protein n=1 Tax=Saprolegnia diclina (strain VS20) TaxID=1156394 RepID=T0PH70_SAPDV|nr:hypothetical protein SDRG_17393 [Saprolegnia diclina VS20]EQC24714.1 hypothetical protein SDRG_17393 [Saprolegnia diclina VS20]|eukprot:XP_008621857.1 hypothetical protein SDRG_17393 [Saprolegnia diclina VS20]